MSYSSKKPHVVIFFGGDEGSHDLSVETGFWVCQYIPRMKYRITPVHVTASGQWQVPLGSLPQQGPVNRMMTNIFKVVPNVSPSQGLERLLQRPVDSIITLLRGRGGDDGSLHGLSNSLSIPMVGPSLEVCQQTSDKYLCGQRVNEIVQSPLSRRYKKTKGVEEIVNDIREILVPPVFVKPVYEENSIGVEEVNSVDELSAAVHRALEVGDILIQKKATGTEVSVSLYGDSRQRIHVLPTTIVVPQTATYYDSLAKRRAGRVRLNTQIDNSNKVLNKVVEAARDIYSELGCEGLVSLDMSVGDDKAELLEVNTVPTLTALTPLKQQLEAGGVHPGKLWDEMIRQKL